MAAGDASYSIMDNVGYFDINQVRRNASESLTDNTGYADILHLRRNADYSLTDNMGYEPLLNFVVVWASGWGGILSPLQSTRTVKNQGTGNYSITDDVIDPP